MEPVPEFRQLIKQAATSLQPSEQVKLSRYLELVWYYGQVFNLTAFSGPQDLLNGLVFESLRLFELGPIQDGAEVVDMGSGNGSPVVPLAVCCPGAQFTAVEANRKRSTFLQTVAASLGLSNLKVVGTRVEMLFTAGRRYDIVTSRAFAQPFQCLEAARQLVRPGGEVRGFAGVECGPVTRATQALGMGRPRFIEYRGAHGTDHVWKVTL